MVDGS
jgi:hypothetical protein